ncbi:MAG: prolyl oligopeptidase family serine peptidase [Bacteroidia bacterium]|nr:prolyl oligopeptidase family serine peptidase [Bacteroidia bacterium]
MCKSPNDEEKKIVFNTNDLGVISGFEPEIEELFISGDQSLLAIKIKLVDAKIYSIRILDLKKLEVLKDKIDFLYNPSVFWYKKGFFYTKFFELKGRKLVEEKRQTRVMYHRIKSNSKNDVQVYLNADLYYPYQFKMFLDEPTSRLFIGDNILYQGKKLFGIYSMNCDSITNPQLSLIYLNQIKFDQSLDILGSNGKEILLRTSKGSPTFSIIAIDPEMGLNQGRVVVPANVMVLKEALFSNNRIFGLYYFKGSYSILVMDFEGKLVNMLNFPVGYKISDLKSGQGEDYISLRVTSFNLPESTYLINQNTLEGSWLAPSQIHFSNKEYHTDYEEYYSYDSLKIPMYICYKDSLKRDGNAPVLLYGYGGFGFDSDPFFDELHTTWMELGGVLAFPAIRGGADLGLDWYESTKGKKKNTCINDFIYAAEYLIKTGVTRNERLAISGGSHGGWLVNMVANRRPELMKAVISDVGVSDLLVTQSDTTWFIIQEEFGKLETEEDVKFLMEISPIYTIDKQKVYPSVLFQTALNDLNVNYLQVLKYREALKQNPVNTNPNLLIYNADGDHFGANNYLKFVEDEIKKLQFLIVQLGMDNLYSLYKKK